MARAFARASSMKLQRASAVVSAAPLTMACWFRMASSSLTDAVMNIFNSSDAQRFGIFVSNTNFLQCKVNDSTAGTITATSSTSISTNTWYHACAVFTSTTSRDIYTNGGGVGSSSTSVTPSGLDTTEISGLFGGSYLDGRVADAAIWNVALTTNEITALSAGCSPQMVRPLSLVTYWPLYGFQSPEQDYCGSNSLTLTNAPTQADGPPRVTRFRRRAYTDPITSGGGDTVAKSRLLLGSFV